MVRPPYPVAVRLCSVAALRWPQIDAAYYLINPPLLRQKPHRFANMVYSWVIERVDPEKLDEFHQDLEDLLPWQDSSSAAAEQIESASFMDMMAKGGGG